MGVGGGMIRCQPYFSTKSGSVARVWAAFCERSFEEGPAILREVQSKYNKKCTYASKARIDFLCPPIEEDKGKFNCKSIAFVTAKPRTKANNRLSDAR